MKKRTSQNLENKSDKTILSKHEESKELFQKTLEQAEDKFKLLVDQAGEAFFILDFGGEIIDVNQEASRSLGYSRRELLKMTIQQVDIKVVEKEYKNRFWNPLKTREYLNFEGMHQRKDGSTFPVEVRLGRLDLEGRKLLLALARDISERKKSELALIESESKLRKAQEIAKIGIWGWDLVADKGYYSEETYKIFDVDPDPDTKIVSEKMIEIIHPEDREHHDYITMNLLNKNVSNEPYDYRIIHRDGTIRHVYTEVQVEYDADDNPVKMGGIVQDITRRKQAEQALKKEAEFQELVAKISSQFVNLPADKIDEAINEQFKEIGEYFNADRVTIGYLPEKGEPLPATYMWFSDEKIGEKITAQMMGATFPNLVNYLKDQEYWSFSVLEPDEYSHWLPERETIEKTGIKSGLAINTSFENSILEIFVIDFIQSNRVWSKNIIEQVKLLGNVFSNALNRKRAEQALQKEFEFKQLVSALSSRFIGLSGVKFDDAIKESLKEIGRYFGVDGVRLLHLSLQGKVLKYRFMWQSEDLAPQDEMAEVHKMIYPNLATHFSSGKSVVFNKFMDSPQWPEFQKILKFLGTKSGVGVPLDSEKSGVEIFAMDSVLLEHQWPEDTIERSKTIGQALLNAILRREAEVEIQKGYVEIKRLKNQLQQENIYLKEEIKGIKNFDTIIGQSKALKYVLFRVEQVAPTDTTVLISGETGTGKEVFTNALHQLSLRKNKSLVKVNCAALSPTLIESELFGHEKGAFTGANEKRIGRFELADGGTIFLDEISELSLELQAKLLRVLQEGEFERLGSSKTIKANIRIIAATNRNLEEEVKNNRFRVDLYYRLTTFIITIPPLRDRKDDIPLLVEYLVNKLGKKLNKSIKRVPQTVMRNLVNYSWPGNVRELENVIENALIISNGDVLKAEVPGKVGLTTTGKSKLEDLEREHIIKILKLVNWQIGGKEGAAEKLGLKRTTLNSKMKKLNIKKTSR
jgi:formate hydrogenlyase transcriptional activator